MTKLNYEQDVQIDPDALDVEWLEQADLMRRYATHAAQTRQEMDEAKERLEVMKASIEMDIRSQPEIYGLTKVTEGGIQSTIMLQKEYQGLTEAYISARYENEVANAAVRAIDQKKTALENLVKLLGQSYFAGPLNARDLSQEYMDQLDQRKRNASIKMKRRSD